MHARITWLCGPDREQRRAGCVRVHPTPGDPAYGWACTVCDDGAGGLEFHGVLTMGADALAIRSALYACALAEGFTAVVWWRLRGASMEARRYRLDAGRSCPAANG